MSQTKAQLLDNIKDNVQLDARNALRFADTDSSHYVAFKAPATVSSNVTWTLPAADGSANYVLATDGSGTLSWIADPAGQWVTSGSNIYFTGGNVGIGDSSPSNPLSVTGASAFNGDVTFTGASYNALWDKSANALEFADSAKASFGAGEDLSIYHTDPNGFIKYQNENGHLRILSGVSGNGGIQLKNRTDDETYLTCISDGAVELYHNNVKRFETSSAGTEVIGKLTFSGDGNSNGIELGADADLNLYHDNSNAYIDNNVGDFYIRNDGNSTSENIRIQAKGGEQSIVATADGAVEIYYDNAKKLNTSSTGVVFQGNANVSDSSGYGGSADHFFSAGNSSDLKIYHHGSWGSSYINNSGSGALFVESQDLRFRKSDGNELYFQAVADGAVSLYHNNQKKIETLSNGARIYSEDGAEAVLEYYADRGDQDADKFRTLASVNADWFVQNYHDGSWETNIKVLGAGAVEIYHNNVKLFETQAGGCKSNIAGSNTFTIGSTDASGAYLVLDGDSNGDGTGSDYASIIHGTDGDLSIHADNPSGDSQLELYVGSGTTTALIAEAAGAVQLYHNGTKKFETNQYGVKVCGSTDNSRIDFTDAYANTRIGYFGLNRFGIDCHDGLEIRDSSDSYATRLRMDENGHVLPGTTNMYDLGNASVRWRNIYTNDLNLSNEGLSNDVDGTWGSYTIQEGSDDLFLINKRNGKRYKFNLTEVS